MAENEKKSELQLEDVKVYLRIDIDDDDATLRLIIDAARKYVEKQIGECNEEDPRVKMLLLAVIANMYENRMLTTSKPETESYVVKIMIMQLQMERGNNA